MKNRENAAGRTDDIVTPEDELISGGLSADALATRFLIASPADISIVCGPLFPQEPANWLVTLLIQGLCRLRRGARAA